LLIAAATWRVETRSDSAFLIILVLLLRFSDISSGDTLPGEQSFTIKGRYG